MFSNWNEGNSVEFAQKVSDNLQKNNLDSYISWSSNVVGESIELIKETRGVKSSIFINKEILQSPEAIALGQISEDIASNFSEPATLVKKEEQYVANSPTILINLIDKIGKKGLTLQRFKGLGEMNAEQLWETTLDPSNRTLLQVRIDQFDEADETFSTLMGNVVEPRREFIQQNALKVVNLDV